MRSVLSIAGSDSSGGAGIQADIKTISAFGLYAQTAITALTAQNTTGVYGIVEVDPEFVSRQIDIVFEDIRPDAVKIGMVPTAECAYAVAEALARNNASNIVLDPVMVSTSGSSLSSDPAVRAIVKCLMPIADVATPNLPEAQTLSGMTVACEDDMVQAARIIRERMAAKDADISDSEEGLPDPGNHGDSIGYGCRNPQEFSSCGKDAPAILVKGGHFAPVVEELEGGFVTESHSDDFLLNKDGQEIWIVGERIDNPNTHGTGCTLSSAIACGLASGYSIERSCRNAKEYIARILSCGKDEGFDLGKASGPLDHLSMLRREGDRWKSR